MRRIPKPADVGRGTASPLSTAHQAAQGRSRGQAYATGLQSPPLGGRTEPLYGSTASANFLSASRKPKQATLRYFLWQAGSGNRCCEFLVPRIARTLPNCSMCSRGGCRMFRCRSFNTHNIFLGLLRVNSKALRTILTDLHDAVVISLTKSDQMRSPRGRLLVSIPIICTVFAHRSRICPFPPDFFGRDRLTHRLWNIF
jgi:hypothetical protein